MTEVVVVDYGAGNTQSVRAALRRLGHTSVVTSDPGAILDAALVILPGVGSARSAMAQLHRSGADEALRTRFAAERFTLGICLGMQLALESSEEDGGVVGLGLLEGRVERLREGRVPRLGWSLVEPWGGAYYFAHSYAAVSDDIVATAEGVTAAVERGSFLGVQFHPEKSG
ncbi:MAG TPA: imidazole glycerol phosphate synthase subunit HisH, partial [Acidimicrobiales bacterium]|nr:imidazole glycerol phosphate synthase subunit HisH [Acidimicrobiales bacterium]